MNRCLAFYRNFMQLTIKGKTNKKYSVIINKENFKKEIVNKRLRWSVPHEVFSSKGEKVGHGHFSASCQAQHDHIPDDLLFRALIKICVKKIKADLDSGQDIESKGYNLSIWDCTK